jgi:ribosome biogenesis GTPase A
MGYPNVGKSSLINAMTGRGSARTSSEPGFTRGVQWIKVKNNFMLLDTPGVIPATEKDDVLMTVMGSKKIDSYEAELIVEELMMKFPDRIERKYEVSSHEDPEETLIEIAEKRNFKKKGNLPDTSRAAQMIILDIQKGKIQLI